MNINNIRVGETYKNWKALCEALGIEPKSGGYKAKQEKDFRQYFNWTKEGQKIIITVVYDEVQERVDGRGKSEGSQKAIRENHHSQPSFFKEDELQLAILWTLGAKYYESIRNEESSLIYIPKNKMHVELGLCNEYFNTLFRDRHYYCKLNNNDVRETVFDLWKLRVAFDLNNKFSNIDGDMQHHVITAFNQLQRKKVLEFAYWKVWGDGVREQLLTDEQMKTFLDVREMTLTWWNEEHRNRVCETVGDVYKTLLPKEIKEFENKFKEALSKTEQLRGLKYYFSCYKTIFSISTIKRELKKHGYNVGITSQDFNNAFIENMANTVIRINSKFIQRHVERINKLRDCQIDKQNEYDKKITEYYEQLEKLDRRGFGRRKVEKPKAPNTDMVEQETYEEVLDILYLGLKLLSELNEEQDGIMQGIEHCIKVNIN